MKEIASPRLVRRTRHLLVPSGQRPPSSAVTTRLIERIVVDGFPQALLAPDGMAEIDPPLPHLPQLSVVTFRMAEPRVEIVAMTRGQPETYFSVTVAVRPSGLRVIGSMYGHLIGDAVDPTMWSYDQRADPETGTAEEVFAWEFNRHGAAYEVRVARMGDSGPWHALCVHRTERGDWTTGIEGQTAVLPEGETRPRLAVGVDGMTWHALDPLYLIVGRTGDFDHPQAGFKAMLEHLRPGPGGREEPRQPDSRLPKQLRR